MHRISCTDQFRLFFTFLNYYRSGLPIRKEVNALVLHAVRAAGISLNMDKRPLAMTISAGRNTDRLTPCPVLFCPAIPGSDLQISPHAPASLRP
jgi:hypothetical protein